MDSYDTTRFDYIEIEFGEAKKMIAILELENSKLEEQKARINSLSLLS